MRRGPNKVSSKKGIYFKFLRLVLVSVLWTTAVVYRSSDCTPVSTQSNKVTIFHTNDMHGALDSCYTPEGKLLQIGADVTKSLKDSTPNSILIDSGDATQGGMLASSSQGSKIIEIMNAAGYDVMGIGNHEFDYGLDALKLNATLAEFPMLSANLCDSEGNPILRTDRFNGCNIILQVGGKKIGVFAITTRGTKHTTHPKNIEGVIFKDEIETALNQCRYLREKGADVVILVSHVGTTDPELTTEIIAQQVPGIDIIIDGHSHEVYSKTVGHTFIQQVGTKSKNIGKIEIEFYSDRSFTVGYRIISAGELINPLNPDLDQIIPDSNIASLCKKMIQRVSEAFHIIIGRTESGLYGGEYHDTRICRLQDTNLGSLMGDALVYYGKNFLKSSGIEKSFPVVSLQNGGGIRTSVFPGFISAGDIINIFPFPNKTAIKILTAKELYEVLENGVKTISIKNGVLSGPDGAFPNVGGMRLEYDITQQPMMFNSDKNKIIEKGARIQKIVLLDEDGSDKVELSRDDSKTQVALTTNTFETSGGDQYIMLKEFPSIIDDGNLLSEILTEYIEYLTLNNNGVFNYPVGASRVKLIGEEKLFSQYDAQIFVKENSVELQNQKVEVTVDNQKSFNEKTDEKGSISLKDLDPGPHDIKISKGHLFNNAYVNNKVGITDAHIFLESRSEQDVKNVISIIDGILDQKMSDLPLYIIFARNAYESLTDEEKSLVTNYKDLLSTEKTVKSLNCRDQGGSQNHFGENIRRFYTATLVLALLAATWAVMYASRSQMRKKY